MATDTSTLLRLVRNLTQSDIQQADSKLLLTIADYIGQLQHSEAMAELTPELMGKMAQLKTAAEQANLNVLQVKSVQELEEQTAQRHERQRLAHHIKQIEALYQQRNENQLTAEQRAERERKAEQEQQRFQQEVARYLAMSDAEFNQLSASEKTKVLNTLWQDSANKTANAAKTMGAEHPVIKELNATADYGRKNTATPPDVQDLHYAKAQHGYAAAVAENERRYQAGEISLKQRDQNNGIAKDRFNFTIVKNEKEPYQELGERYVRQLAQLYGLNPDSVLHNEKALNALQKQVEADRINGTFAEKEAQLATDQFYHLQMDIQQMPQLEKAREALGKKLGEFVIAHTETGKWTGENAEHKAEYYQLRLDYAKATFAEMSAKLASQSLARTKGLDESETEVLKLEMHFGEGKFSGKQDFVVRQRKGEGNELMGIYEDILTAGFEKIAELKGDNAPPHSAEYRIKYNAVTKLLEDFTSNSTHFTLTREGKAPEQVSHLNEVFGKMLALAKLKADKGTDSSIIEQATKAELEKLAPEYAKELIPLLQKKHPELSAEEVNNIAIKLAEHTISSPDLHQNKVHAYKFRDDLIDSYQNVLDSENNKNKQDNEKIIDKERDSSLKEFNNLAKNVKENNVIAVNNIQLPTLEDVHKQEATNRQQAVKIEEENVNQLHI